MTRGKPAARRIGFEMTENQVDPGVLDALELEHQPGRPAGWEAGTVNRRAFMAAILDACTPTVLTHAAYAGCDNRRMIVAVDVGNTQTHVGAFEGADLVGDWRLATRGDSTADELALALSGSMQFRDLAWDDVSGRHRLDGGPASRPRIRAPLREPSRGAVPARRAGGEDRDADQDRQPPRARLRPARQRRRRPTSGSAAAACRSTSGPRSTSTPSPREGEYLGGVIAPGLEVSIEALSSRAAKLPRIQLEEPDVAIGRNTLAALQSGFVFGFAGLVDGIVTRMLDELGTPATVIATGGMATSIAPLCETIDEVDSYLTLKGLRLIWERNRMSPPSTPSRPHRSRSRSAASRSPTGFCWRRSPGSGTGSCVCRPVATAPGSPSRRWSPATPSTTATSAR